MKKKDLKAIPHATCPPTFGLSVEISRNQIDAWIRKEYPSMTMFDRVGVVVGEAISRIKIKNETIDYLNFMLAAEMVAEISELVANLERAPANEAWKKAFEDKHLTIMLAIISELESSRIYYIDAFAQGDITIFDGFILQGLLEQHNRISVKLIQI